MNSGTKIEGEWNESGVPTVVFTLMANAPTSVFDLQRGILGIKSSSATDIEITGIKFNGNKDNQTVVHGKGYHNFFGGTSIAVSNLSVHDCYVYDNQGDGVRLRGGANIHIYNFNVDRGGHDGVYLENCSDIKIHDCKVLLRSNSAIRVRSSQNAEIYNIEAFTVAGVLSTGPGLEIHTNSGDTALLQNIKIHDCYLHDTHGPAIQLINNTSNVSKDIYIYNNIFKNDGQLAAAYTNVNAVGGVICEGVKNLQIYNNTFDACRGYGVGITHFDLKSVNTGNTVFIKNNIFMNTTTSYKSLTANGTAVANLRTDNHVVESKYNCFLNNALNYKNVSGSNDLLATDPLVYDRTNNDYHLKSQYGRWDGSAWVTDTTSSPCIDAGDPASDYSKEPADSNGGRVNIGRYGNSAEASKSFGGTSSGGVLYVGFGSENDFVCDGVADDVQIQQALNTVRDNSLYTAVHLRTGVYDIAQPLVISSNTTISGDSDAVLRLKDAAAWAANLPILNQNGSSIHDVEIYGFEIDGNRANQTESDSQMYYNIIYWLYADNIKIHDMVMHDCKNDVVRIKYGNNIDVYNSTIYKSGNIGIDLIESSYVEVYGNYVTTRIDSGIRIMDTNHVKIFRNNVAGYDGSDAGIAGIAVVHSKTIVMDDLEIYENYIYDTYGPGILIIKGAASDAALTAACNGHIHHNIFKNCGLRDDIDYCGAIATKGWNNLLIENNDIYACLRYGIAAITGTGYSAASGTGYVIQVRNNIISGILEGGVTPAGTGVGVANTLTSTHSINCHHNCVNGSAANNYVGVTPSSDINADPLWYDPTIDDYHLKSQYGRWNGFSWVTDENTSPCIDAGDPASDYSKEPTGNGSRINIGRYGNTSQASKSAAAPTWSDYFSVARESGYDYYCDGTDDQVQINQALTAAANSTTKKTVLLKPGTYVVKDTVNVPTGTTIAGETGAIVQLAAGLSWEKEKPMFQIAQGSSNVRFSSFIIDGNRGSYPSLTSGQLYHNLIMGHTITNVTIDNMTLRNNHNDAVNLNSCTTVRYFKNWVDRCGHDGLYCTNCSDIKAYDCKIQCRTNCAIRMYNSNNAEIYNNEIWSASEGGAGLQMQQYGTGTMDKIVLRNNVIHHTNSSGIWLYGGNASAVSKTQCEIYDNILYNCGTRQTSGSFIHGILAWGWNAEIHHNIFDGNYGAGVSVSYVAGYTAHAGSGYQLNIDKCIISNSGSPGNNSVVNALSPSHIVSVTNSDLYNCSGGTSGTISTSGNITSDPQYTDRTNRDYSLPVGSPMYSAFDGHVVGIITYTPPPEDPTDPGTTDPGTTDPGTTDPGTIPEDPTTPEPTPVNVGTEVLDGRTVVYAEYVPESSLGVTPGAPAFRAFPGDLTKIEISSGAEFDEFEILKSPSEGDRLSCGVAIKTVEKMHTVKIHLKPSSLGLLPYAICAANTASYTAPGTSVWPSTIGVRIGNKYTTIKGCVLQSIEYDFPDVKKAASCIMTFFGIDRTNWSTTDYAASGSHATPSSSAPYTIASLSNIKYDDGTAESKGFIVDSLKFGFENSVTPVLSTSGIPESRIVGWSYGAMEIPVTLGISLTDPVQQDSAKAGNAHTLTFALGGKTFSFSSLKWSNDADIDVDPGSKIGMSLDAAPKAVRVSFT